MTTHKVMVGQMTRCLVVSGVAAAFSFPALIARAQESHADQSQTIATHSLIIRKADATEQGDGAVSAAVKAARRGPRPVSDADVAAKAAANMARDKAEKSATPRPFNSAETAPPAGHTFATSSTPVIVGGFEHSRRGA